MSTVEEKTREEAQVPDGIVIDQSGKEYMTDSQGKLVPADIVSDIDKARDGVVRDTMSKVLAMQAELREFKGRIMGDLKSFIELSSERFGVQIGGKKGNVTLTSYDGEYKIVIAVNEHIYFDERLQVAKELIDECIKEWSEGARSEIQALVNDAFYVDKQGKLNTNRILGLRRLAIEHPKWKKAMDAITESIQVSGSKEYVRFYRRNNNGAYDQVSLDLASL